MKALIIILAFVTLECLCIKQQQDSPSGLLGVPREAGIEQSHLEDRIAAIFNKVAFDSNNSNSPLKSSELQEPLPNASSSTHKIFINSPKVFQKIPLDSVDFKPSSRPTQFLTPFPDLNWFVKDAANSLGEPSSEDIRNASVNAYDDPKELPPVISQKPLETQAPVHALFPSLNADNKQSIHADFPVFLPTPIVYSEAVAGITVPKINVAISDSERTFSYLDANEVAYEKEHDKPKWVLADTVSYSEKKRPPAAELNVTERKVIHWNQLPLYEEAIKEWGVAWEFHVYSVAVLFVLLSVYSAYNVVFRSESSLVTGATYLVLNTITFIFGIARAAMFFHDAYNLKGSCSHALVVFILNLGLPCLLIAFTTVLHSVLSVTKVQLLDRCTLCSPILIISSSLYVVLTVLGNVLQLWVPKTIVLAKICHLLLILWFIILAAVYCFMYPKLRRSISRMKRNLILKKFASSHLGAPGPAPSYSRLTMAINITLASSILAFVISLTLLYGIFEVVNLEIPPVYPRPWPWWIYQFSLRVLEVLLAYLLLFVGSLGFFPLDKNTRRNKGFDCLLRLFNGSELFGKKEILDSSSAATSQMSQSCGSSYTIKCYGGHKETCRFYSGLHEPKFSGCSAENAMLGKLIPQKGSLGVESSVHYPAVHIPPEHGCIIDQQMGGGCHHHRPSGNKSVCVPEIGQYSGDNNCTMFPPQCFELIPPHIYEEIYYHTLRNRYDALSSGVSSEQVMGRCSADAMCKRPEKDGSCILKYGSTCSSQSAGNSFDVQLFPPNNICFEGNLAECPNQHEGHCAAVPDRENCRLCYHREGSHFPTSQSSVLNFPDVRTLENLDSRCCLFPETAPDRTRNKLFPS